SLIGCDAFAEGAAGAALSEPVAAEAAARGAGAAAWGACAAGAGADLAGAPATALPAPPMTPTTAPTGATSPSRTRISLITPASVAGTSIETLSVSISNRLSPGLTASPADLNHFVILPSATVSPSCGIKMSMAYPGCVATTLPKCIACPKIPSGLRGRLRGRG